MGTIGRILLAIPYLVVRGMWEQLRAWGLWGAVVVFIELWAIWQGLLWADAWWEENVQWWDIVVFPFWLTFVAPWYISPIAGFLVSGLTLAFIAAIWLEHEWDDPITGTINAITAIADGIASGAEWMGSDARTERKRERRESWGALRERFSRRIDPLRIRRKYDDRPTDDGTGGPGPSGPTGTDPKDHSHLL